jgi:hypothetical protein
MDGRKYRHVETEPARVQQPTVSLDVALFLQCPHAPKAGWRRDADPLCQFDIRDSAVGLDLAQDFEVDLVKILRHGISSFRNRPVRAVLPATLLA